MKNRYRNFQAANRDKIKHDIKQIKNISSDFYITDEKIKELDNIEKNLKRIYNIFKIMFNSNITYITFIEIYE